MSRPFWVDHCVHAQYQLETALNDSMCRLSSQDLGDHFQQKKLIFFDIVGKTLSSHTLEIKG